MNTFRWPVSSVVFLGFCLVFASSAQAQQRRFVSGGGNDANPCSLAEPCRSFPPAIAAVNAGGEVVVLDSAGYGAFTIDKAVTVVVPPGIHGAITVNETTCGANCNGITINAGVDDVVVLRGLSISGLGTVGNGILFTSGTALFVESLTITGFTDGIDVAGDVVVTIKDTIVGGNSSDGIFLNQTDFVTAEIENVVLTGNNVGLHAQGGASATVRNSIISDNETAGVLALTGSRLTIENCSLSDNNTGVSASGTSTVVHVSNSTVTINNTGLSQIDPALLESRGNNTIRRNGIDMSGTITTVPAN